MVAWKKEEGLVTISSECGLVKPLLNWYNNEQHISYLSKVRALLGHIRGPISFRHILYFFCISEKVIWVSYKWPCLTHSHNQLVLCLVHLCH